MRPPPENVSMLDIPSRKQSPPRFTTTNIPNPPLPRRKSSGDLPDEISEANLRRRLDQYVLPRSSIPTSFTPNATHAAPFPLPVHSSPIVPYATVVQKLQQPSLDASSPDNLLPPNGPGGEHLIIYRSYTREVSSADMPYEAQVRGWAYYPHINRKGKLMIAAIERLVGLPVKIEEEQMDNSWRSAMFRTRSSKSLKTAGTASTAPGTASNTSPNTAPSTAPNTAPNSRPHSRSNSRSNSAANTEPNSPSMTSYDPSLLHPATDPLLGVGGRPIMQRSLSGNDGSSLRRELKSTIRERLAAVAHKSAALRDVQVIVESQPDKRGHTRRRTFWTYTDESGRFAKSCQVPFMPYNVHVVCGSAHETSPVQFVPTMGVSVISDIDDTIRHTGVTRSKRELLQNVFAKSFQDCRLEGVSEWYNRLAEAGCHFHYVSNSPWQLYDVIFGFLKHNSFPEGSIHLKKYGGVFDGLTEPAKGRKKARLEQILTHFPHHQFILVGDSGEADLESYSDLALKFPGQVAAIYIRDVDQQDKLEEGPLPHTPTRTKTSSSLSPSPPGPAVSKDTKPSIPPQLPPRIRATSVDDLIDLGDSPSPSPASTSPSSPAAPRLPPRPKLLRRTSSKIMESLTTVKSAARIFPGSQQEQANRRKSVQCDEDGLFVPSTQDFDIDRLDKRADLWKLRMQKHRRILPNNISLKMWRSPADVEEESLKIVKSTTNLMHSE